MGSKLGNFGGYFRFKVGGFWVDSSFGQSAVKRHNRVIEKQ